MSDVYIEGGRSAVFVNGQVIVLSEIATFILEATPSDGSIALADLTTEVVALAGPPEAPLEAEQLIARLAHELVAHGVLRENEPTTTPLTPAGVRALRHALRHLLSSRSGSWAPPQGVPQVEIQVASERHRVTPILASRLDILDLDAATAAAIAASAAQEGATVALLGADLGRAIHTLTTEGIRCLTLKGLALAVQAHGNVAARGAGDLDLLVHPDDLERAHRALSAAGWTAAPGYPVPGATWAWRHHVRTGYELSLTSPTSMVDLHWHLSPVRSAFPDFDVLWSRAVRVDVFGIQVATLWPFDALAHSATHSAKDGWGWMRGLVDVHRLMANPATWTEADRPLHRDQLLTVGLAARMFGVPDRSPHVVHQALGLADRVWDEVLERQSSGGASHEPTTLPGVAFLRGLRTLSLAGASHGDVWRHVSHSAMPQWLTADETSPHGLVVVPRVLTKLAISLRRRAQDEWHRSA